MKKDTLSLLTLLHEVIAEVGDLKNIQPYPHSDDSFTLEDGSIVKVEMYKLASREIFQTLKIPNILNTREGDVYNISFSVEDVDAQFKKSSYAELVRIIKTVMDILVDQTESLEIGSTFIITPISKLGALRLDPQKYELYKAILTKNLPSNYRMAEGTSFGIRSIFLQKIK